MGSHARCCSVLVNTLSVIDTGGVCSVCDGAGRDASHWELQNKTLVVTSLKPAKCTIVS